jgi:Zn-dependent protease with chaperone function
MFIKILNVYFNLLLYFPKIIFNQMEPTLISYEIHPKEKLYFTIKLIVCVILYPIIFFGLYSLYSIESNAVNLQLKIMMFYAVIIILYLVLRLGLMIGYLKGNAVKINEQQLPEIYEIVKKQAIALEMEKIPDVYLMQAGGVLNAFATRFMGNNYVVIYSDILEQAFDSNEHAVEFIIGHEMGHVKRKHILKRLLLFPAVIVPFLGTAYSRGCEYTCDSIGAALSPKGVRNGLLVLASGKKLYKKINVERFIDQSNTETGFWSWFAEKMSSHPKLSKRVMKFSEDKYKSFMDVKPKFSETNDHSSYFPKA